MGPSNMAAVHQRYKRVLDCIHDQDCSIREACRQTSIPVQTLRDARGIAEIKVVDEKQYNDILLEGARERLLQGEKPRTVKQIELQCRDALGQLKNSVLQFRHERKLIHFSKIF